MGKGRRLSSAWKSKITPSGRWAPPPNSHAKCVGAELAGKKGGDKYTVLARFTTASKVTCKGK